MFNIFNNNYDYAIYTNYQGNVNVSNNIFSKNKVSIRNFGPPCVLNNNYYKDKYGPNWFSNMSKI